MKSQQIAVYHSLKDYMLAVGYANASEQREDDPVWSTLNDNNFKSMMEYKFGVEPRLISVPTTLEAIHEGIKSDEAWVYHEDLEHDDDEEAPVPVNVVATPADGGDEDDGSGFTGGPADTGDQDLGGGTGEPAPTDAPADGGEPEQQPAEPEGEQQPAQEPAQDPEPEAPAEGTEQQPEEKPADEGGDSEQE